MAVLLPTAFRLTPVIDRLTVPAWFRSRRRRVGPASPAQPAPMRTPPMVRRRSASGCRQVQRERVLWSWPNAARVPIPPAGSFVPSPRPCARHPRALSKAPVARTGFTLDKSAAVELRNVRQTRGSVTPLQPTNNSLGHGKPREAPGWWVAVTDATFFWFLGVAIFDRFRAHDGTRYCGGGGASRAVRTAEVGSTSRVMTGPATASVMT